jgi:phosphoribosylanthranilate isomerase
MRIKICGIKTFEEAIMAVEAGANMLGFNFYPPSPRYISPGDCLKLVVRLQTALRDQFAQIITVGVFVDTPTDLVISILRDSPLDVAQLSGDESPEALELLGDRAFKVFRPASAEAMAEMVQRYPQRVLAPYWLIDTYRPGEFGGTGHVADWSLASSLAANAPILLAGGLRVDNVGEAIRQVRPWGVDVASGVESAPGVKDPEKVQAFIHAVRAVEKERN